MPRLDKQSLHERFTTNYDALGCYWADADTGLTAQAYAAAGHAAEYYDEHLFLPGGQTMSICTFSARHVAKLLGEGELYGFQVQNNPSVTDREIILADGHDFLVVQGRYIVDPWYKFMGASEQGVFDLQDQADLPKLKAIYGDPANWSGWCNQANRYMAPGEPGYPAEKVIAYPSPASPRGIARKPSHPADDGPGL